MARGITKAQMAKGNRLYRAADAAFTAVYMGEKNTPWQECYGRAPAEIRDAYDAANRALAQFERELERDGRGWFNSHGYFAQLGRTTSPWTLWD